MAFIDARFEPKVYFLSKSHTSAAQNDNYLTENNDNKMTCGMPACKKWC